MLLLKNVDVAIVPDQKSIVAVYPPITIDVTLNGVLHETEPEEEPSLKKDRLLPFWFAEKHENVFSGNVDDTSAGPSSATFNAPD